MNFSLAQKRITKVFVYGTLKRGMSNAQFIPNYTIKKSQKATTTGTLYYVRSGAFPCLKLRGNNTIHGELYTIEKRWWKQTLRDMDMLEGYPTLYDRKIIEVETENGKDRCWTYVYNGEDGLGEEIITGTFTGRNPNAPKYSSVYDYYYNQEPHVFTDEELEKYYKNIFKY